VEKGSDTVFTLCSREGHNWNPDFISYPLVTPIALRIIQTALPWPKSPVETAPSSCGLISPAPLASLLLLLPMPYLKAHIPGISCCHTHSGEPSLTTCSRIAAVFLPHL
jgi:hypothetical protein